MDDASWGTRLEFLQFLDRLTPQLIQQGRRRENRARDFGRQPGELVRGVSESTELLLEGLFRKPAILGVHQWSGRGNRDRKSFR